MLSTPITADHEHWPAQLADLSDPPEQLWVAGDTSLLLRPMVAIVGSRSSTPYGDRVAADISAGLTEYYVIVSGGAFGIDEAAHRAAVGGTPAAGIGRTVVVQPCGLDKPYPSAHRSLFDSILGRGGLLVSEYPPHGVPSRDRFLARNRIIAALSTGLVVIEAGRISGARAAANWANRLHRPLMAVPGPVTSVQSVGCHELIQAGAHLVCDAADVLKILR